MKKKLFQFKWSGFLAALFFALIPQMRAQEVDDLQEFLDQLASEQNESQVQRGPRKGQSIEIPIGLTEVDLSKFTSYQNRTKTVTVKTSVKFINGTISAASSYSGGTCLLKVYGGATVVLDATAGVNASAANSSNCFAAVGIYEGSTFYECGDITAPDNGEGIAIYKDGENDTFIYVSGKRKGSIYPEVPVYTKEELQAMLNEIAARQAAWTQMLNDALARYNTYSSYLSVELQAEVKAYVIEVQNYMNVLIEMRQEYEAWLSNAPESDYNNLHVGIEKLAADCNAFEAQMLVTLNTAFENAKAQATADIGQKLSDIATEITALDANLAAIEDEYYYIQSQLGDNYYFMRKPTDDLMSVLSNTDRYKGDCSAHLSDARGLFTDLTNGHSIATAEDIVYFYDQIQIINTHLAEAEDCVAVAQTWLSVALNIFDQLEVNFPDEELAFTVRPTDLDKELQLGYKSNRGFVLTSAGMMWFEQKEGADFYLTDAEGNYIVATSGNSTLRAGTKAEATVWTGQSIGNGNYTFFSKTTRRYLGYSGINVNNAIISSPNAYGWTITESELDDLQAFLNLLAEEEETSGSGNSDLTEKDTLDYVLPFFDPDQPVSPTTPFVFPKVPYPIHIIVPDGGYWPIPTPTPGQPRPKDFHPIHIPKGSHVIIDDVMFRDIIGGNHVIYVEGILEINITINIFIKNWEWFIHVGPGGHVIWRPTLGTGDWPRIKNEGTMDVEEGGLDYVENTGTVNHKYGTINWIVNRYIYYFTGGLINNLYNYGQHYHQGGDVLTARNFQGGTYTMKGGSIRNTVVNETDTVFVNRGTFYFYGGIIGGYGSRLIYHGPGAVLRIDGGLFDFTYIKHYWIEAHADYYIRGDYDYGATVPVLLAPSVTIRILYKWIYKFNIVFIGGRPTPRYPLFWGQDFKFNITYFTYIGWQLPNKRWRWYVNEEANTIEPRDEEVEDEDDLQAYLDWLAENQDGESASTEEQPQELDLKNRNIVITKPVEWPTGCHVFIRNGRFVPRTSWTHSRMFYIPATTTVRYEYVIVDLSSTTHYYLNGVPVQRNIFEVYGDFHFGIGCHVKGYVNTLWQVTDANIPGCVVYIDPAARFFLEGGRIDNVIFRINTIVNIYVTQTLVNNIYVYIPTAYRYDGFSFMAPFGDYQFTWADLRKIILWKCAQWAVKVLPDNGYMALFDIATPKITKVSGEYIGVDTQVELSCATAGATIYYTLDGSDPRTNTDGRRAYNGLPIIVDKYTIVKAVAVIPGIMGESHVATFIFGDLNDDGKVDIADGVTVLNIMSADEYNLLADFNNDKKVDIADLVTILNIMAVQ